MKIRLVLAQVLLGIALFSLVSACSDSGIQTDATYKDKNHDDMYKYGSMASDQGGFNLFGGPDDNKKAKENGGIGVNGYLWRATLDTISFMPIASADPFGGLILTDWYSPPDTPDERTKLNIYIRGRDLRADAVKVAVFRQTREGKDGWADAPVAASTPGSLENAILTRARQLRMAQKVQ